MLKDASKQKRWSISESINNIPVINRRLDDSELWG